MPKPRVITQCVANRYAGPNERIIEFSGESPDHGGLISFSITDDGRMIVDIYRQGAKVDVRIGKPDEAIA